MGIRKRNEEENKKLEEERLRFIEAEKRKEEEKKKKYEEILQTREEDKRRSDQLQLLNSVQQFLNPEEMNRMQKDLNNEERERTQSIAFKDIDYKMVNSLEAFNEEQCNFDMERKNLNEVEKDRVLHLPPAYERIEGLISVSGDSHVFPDINIEKENPSIGSNNIDEDEYEYYY